jgi:hypothetical protein
MPKVVLSKTEGEYSYISYTYFSPGHIEEDFGWPFQLYLDFLFKKNSNTH